MIPRSGNFKGNCLLLAIKWRLRSSFYIANGYKFSSFSFVCSFLSLFLRIFWLHGSFTVKESSCPEECCSFERKAPEKLFYRLPACCPRSSSARPRKRNHEHAQPRNLENSYFGNVKKKGGF